MFAYCGNNPVNYEDSSGTYHRSLDSGIRSVSYEAPGTKGTALAQLQGEGRNVDLDPIVIDFSWSFMIPGVPAYGKVGAAVVLDLSEVDVSIYPHLGGGIGYSNGPSLSLGLVDNYAIPDDYDKHFLDVNVGVIVLIDHCWDPTANYDSATKATAISFGSGFGVGYDYYLGPF